MKFAKCIEWGGPDGKWWYFGIHFAERGYRYLGRYNIWYDGPHNGLGLWYFIFTWQTDWMGYDEKNIGVEPRLNDWYHPSYGHLRKK